MKKAIFGNIGTKIMALALAVLMWVYLFSAGVASKELQAEFRPLIPLSAEEQDNLLIEFSYVSPNGSKTSLYAGQKIPVPIAGPRGEVNKQKELALRPEFKSESFDGDTGSFTHEIALDDFGLAPPFRIQKSDLAITSIEVSYQKYIEKEVELLATRDQLSGNPAPGYVIKSVRCNPPRIRVRVASRKADEIKKVPVSLVPIDDLTDSITLPGRIAPDPAGHVKPTRGEPFNVQVVIEPEEISKTFGPITLHVAGKPDVVNGVQLEPPNIYVAIQGPKGVVESLQESEIIVFVPMEIPLTRGDKRQVLSTDLKYYFKKALVPSILTVELMSNTKKENRQVIVSLPGN